MPAGLIARPMAAMAVGLALAEGRIDSLDTPVSRASCTEWEDEPRGRITLRQLLEETSGLEAGGDVARPAAPFAMGRPARAAASSPPPGACECC